MPQYRDARAHAAGAGRVPGARRPAGRGRASAGARLRARPGQPVTAINLAEVLYRRGDYERARFYIRRVNAMPELSNAQTLWLAARIEHKLGNRRGARDFGSQLRNRFPQSREAAAFDAGRVR